MTQRLEVMSVEGLKLFEGSFIPRLVLDAALSQDLN